MSVGNTIITVGVRQRSSRLRLRESLKETRRSRRWSMVNMFNFRRILISREKVEKSGLGTGSQQRGILHRADNKKRSVLAASIKRYRKSIGDWNNRATNAHLKQLLQQLVWLIIASYRVWIFFNRLFASFTGGVYIVRKKRILHETIAVAVAVKSKLKRSK